MYYNVNCSLKLTTFTLNNSNNNFHVTLALDIHDTYISSEINLVNINHSICMKKHVPNIE